MSGLFWPVMILLVAVGLLILECFIPSGGVIGVLSALAFATAVGTAFSFCGLKIGTAFLAGTAALIPGLIYLAVLWWPKTPIGRRILIQPPDEQLLRPDGHRERQQWVGRRAIAVTALLPSGAIRLGERTVDAMSDGMAIEKDSVVEIVAVRGVHLIVRPTDQPVADGSSPATSEPLRTEVLDPFDDSLP